LQTVLSVAGLTQRLALSGRKKHRSCQNRAWTPSTAGSLPSCRPTPGSAMWSLRTRWGCRHRHVSGGSSGSNVKDTSRATEDRTRFIETRCGPLPKADLECVTLNSIEFSRAQTALKRDEAEAARKQAAEDRKAIAKSDAAIAEHQKAAAKSDAGAAAHRTAAQYLRDISVALTANPPRITVAEARAAKTTPTPSDDPCVWRERLQPRLGALTKQ
jgi:hypothetical protein